MPANAFRHHLATRAEWSRPLWLIEGSQGNSGLPRTHPNHRFVIVEGVDRGDGYQGYLSVDYAYRELIKAGLHAAAEHLDALTGISAYEPPAPDTSPAL